MSSCPAPSIKQTGYQHYSKAGGRSQPYFDEKQDKKQKTPAIADVFYGDPCENRTRVTAVKGPCLNLLTNGPYDRGKNATAQYIKGNHQAFCHEKPSDTCQAKEKTG